MQPLCIDEEQRQKTIRGWVTAAHWKIACLLTMAVLLVLLLIFITLYVSGKRLCYEHISEDNGLGNVRYVYLELVVVFL